VRKQENCFSVLRKNLKTGKLFFGFEKKSETRNFVFGFEKKSETRNQILRFENGNSKLESGSCVFENRGTETQSLNQVLVFLRTVESGSEVLTRST